MCRKILLINPFGIGDVLFTTPLIHTLKDAFDGVKLGYLCNNRSAGILKNNPCIDYIFVYDRDEFAALRRKSFLAWVKKSFGFLGQIKAGCFDTALDFSLNPQYGFFSWYAGIKNRVGYDFKKRGGFLTKRIGFSGYSQKHVVEYYADLLKCLGIDSRYNNLELYLKEEDKKRIAEILSKKGISSADFLLGIIPGAGGSWGKDAYLKHWKPEKFARLADKLVENYKAKVIIMGDFLEKNLVQAVTDNMRNKAIDLSGMTTIGELAALLSRMRLVVTNDGGPLHMAVALGVKTISIFGMVDETVYGPYPKDSNHIVIKRDMPCRPCYRNFRLLRCLNNRRCIEDIAVDEVYSAAQRLI